MTGLVLLVDALAAFRLTWLVTHDQITARLRGRLIRLGYRRHYNRAYLDTLQRRANEHGGVDFDLHADAWDQVVEMDEAPPRLAYIWSCPWCAGVWVSAAVVAARHLAPGAWGPCAEALAVAALVALVAEATSNLQR